MTKYRSVEPNAEKLSAASEEEKWLTQVRLAEAAP